MQAFKEFETVSQTAERLGVTVRAVQKWAAAGKFPEAVKHGRSWMIPKGAVPDGDGEVQVNKSSGIPGVYSVDPFRMALPFLNGAYPLGKAEEYINSMPDEDDRAIAMGEYCYYQGRVEEAIAILTPYLDSDDPSLRYSANSMFTFANLAAGHIHLSHFSIGNTRDMIRRGLASDAPVEFHAIGIYTATAFAVLFHTQPPDDLPPLEDFIRYLPPGFKLFACYVLAHKAYLEKNYVKSLTIAEHSMLMFRHTYPIASMYLHVSAAMALVNLKRMDEAKAHVAKAWELAKKDGIYSPFSDHHGLLHGILELHLKKEAPEEYEKVIKLSSLFRSGWQKIHNAEANREVAENLSSMEFTVAMLYNRGWLMKEIADHMGISINTVRTHIKSIFNKLGIADKDELAKYMLI